jgi:hypothetical protein
VPPVPAPVTQCVGGASAKSAAISAAVVRSCASALASLSNWLGRNQPCACASSRALASMPLPFRCAGVSTTCAPRKRISRRRSTLKFSAITITSGWPRRAHTIASPMPVLPLVASTTVWPSTRRPFARASSITASAMRSLTEPIGLKDSSLA